MRTEQEGGHLQAKGRGFSGKPKLWTPTVDALILDFQPLELWKKNERVLLKSPVCGTGYGSPSELMYPQMYLETMGVRMVHTQLHVWDLPTQHFQAWISRRGGAALKWRQEVDGEEVPIQALSIWEVSKSDASERVHISV